MKRNRLPSLFDRLVVLAECGLATAAGPASAAPPGGGRGQRGRLQGNEEIPCGRQGLLALRPQSLPRPGLRGDTHFHSNLAKLNDEGTFRFFYITNRDLTSCDELLQYPFGNEREDTLKIGLFETTDEPSLGIGILVNPTDWMQNEEIEIENVSALEQDEFLQQLREFVDRSAHSGNLISEVHFENVS